MKVDARGLSASARAAIESWGWELCDDIGVPDAVLSEAGGKVEIRVSGIPNLADVAFLPLNRQELEYRIASARCLRARLLDRLHDLRSPLNAIQGYAEMLIESTDGETQRFASNICTASQVLTAKLEALHRDGV